MRPNPSLADHACLSIFVGLNLILSLAPVNGQGTMSPSQVYRTTENQPLISDSLSVYIPSVATGNPWLAFEFGFETDEVFGPGTIFDSFSISLVDDASSLTAVLLTADVAGVVYGPPTPGGVELLPGAFASSLIPIPVLQPNLSQQLAASLNVMLPPEFADVNATLYLDLFDNQNGVSSLGWFDNLTVVPEPSVSFLIAAGFLGLAARRWILR